MKIRLGQQQLANNMKGLEQRKTNNVPTFVTFQWVSNNIVFASVDTQSKEDKQCSNFRHIPMGRQ